MAFVKSIWFYGERLKNPIMRVNIQLKPAGEVYIDVPIPKDFHDCILGLAYTAADHHEQLMKAEILAGDKDGKSITT